MLTERRIRTAAFLSLLVLALPSLAVAQKSAASAPLIKTSLTVDSDTLKRDKPGTVTVSIENISGKEIDIKSHGAFELFSLGSEAVARKHEVFGDSYWSPVNVTAGTPLGLTNIDPKLLKKGVIQGQVPKETLRFAKGETRTFKLDLTKTLWNASMGNDWPRWNLFETVAKGSYTLVFRFENEKSNGVKVSVE